MSTIKSGKFQSDREGENLRSWNNVAEAYERGFMDLDLYNDSYDFFLKSLENQSAEILEIGCGPGNITRYLLSKCPELKILGIDTAQNMIDLAIKNVVSADFIVMDARKIDGLKKTFDGIVCGFCIPYLSEKDTSEVLQNCSDKLNPNGILYLSFVEGMPENSGYITGSTNDRMYFQYHSKESIQKEMQKNKMEVFKEFRKNYQKADGSSEIHIIVLGKKAQFIK